MTTSVILCCLSLLVLAVHANSNSYNGPIMIQGPEDTIYDTFTNVHQVSLICSVTGDMPITYRWLFNGNEVDPTDDRFTIANGQLTIQNPDRLVDQGEYYCQATNHVGTIRSLPAQLMFAYVDDFAGNTNSRETLTEGEGGCLDCQPPDHYPAIITSWMKGSGNSLLPLSITSRMRVMNDGRLCFAYVEASDAATYRCKVRSNVESTLSTAEKISDPIEVTTNTVSSPRTTVTINDDNKPADVKTLVGETISFECFVYGRTGSGSYSPPSISWRRTLPVGESMPSGAVQTDGGQMLDIRNVQFADAGTYECFSGTGISSVSAQAELSVVEPPHWVEEPKSAQRDIETDVSWDVEADSNSQTPITYTWYRNGESFTSMERHAFTNNFQSLTVSDLEVPDTAMYQCFADNTHGAIYSSAQLTVRSFAPEFLEPMEQDQPAPLGATVTVACPVDGAPYPTIEWSHGGNTISDSAHYNLTADHPNLVIVDVQNSDGGEYTCKATNDQGEVMDTGSLIIREATIIVSPPENTEVRVGVSATLTCRATHDANLDLTYIWERNGQEMDLSDRDKFVLSDEDGVGDLEIVEPTMQDGGEYTCVALTPADSDMRTADLVIQGPPGPPSGLTVMVSQRTADLSWSPGSDNNEPITAFIVEGKTDFSDEWTTLRTENSGGTNSVRLTNLRAYSLYTFRVHAVNSIGSGTPSEEIQANEMTAKDRPESSPSNVGGGGGNDGDLRITWDTFTASEWNSDTIAYVVEWERVQSQVPQTFKLEVPDATVYVATNDIALYTQYKVRVGTENDVGLGPFSDWVNIYSYQQAPQDAPSKVEASGSSASAIAVSWDGISTSNFQGELMGYKVLYWTDNSNKNNADIARSEGTGTSASIPNLSPNTRYSVVVMAYSGGGDGPESSTVTAVTLKQAPQQKPTNIASTADGTEIKVTWNGISTSSSEESLQGYKVRYRLVGVFEEDAEIVDVPATETEAIISGLSADTTYIITVQGYSAGGLGANSSPYTVTTGSGKTGQSQDGGGGSRTVAALSLTLLLVTFIHTIHHLL